MTSILPPDELCKLSDSHITPHSIESFYDLRDVIEQLESAQAEIIKLYYYDGKTDLEISRLRNVSRQAVNSLKHRALRNLKYLLSESLSKAQSGDSDEIDRILMEFLPFINKYSYISR